jgi:Tfp pilus assembly protein PilF
MTRLVRKSLIFVFLLLVIAAAGWFGHKAYAKAMERRCLEDAEDCLEKRDFLNATLCLRRVLELNPKNIDVPAKMAELLEAQGLPGAVDWRIRAAELHPREASFRFDWAESALKARDVRSAARALEGIDDTARETAQYQKLAGALDWSLGHLEEAEKHYAKALQLDPTNQKVAFNLATIRLRSTNSATADAARLSMERMMSNPSLKLTALRQLVSFEELRQAPTEALKYSTNIVKDPTAGYADKLGHLELLHRARSADYDPWLAELKREATNSSARAFAMGKWIAKVNGIDASLAWINTLPEDIQGNPPLVFLIADCYVLLKDWQALLDRIESQNWGEADAQRMALIALARRSLGQETAFQTAWREALRAADHHRDSLLLLVRFASSWGLSDQKREVLELFAAEFPKEKLPAEMNSNNPPAALGEAPAVPIEPRL